MIVSAWRRSAGEEYSLGKLNVVGKGRVMAPLASPMMVLVNKLHIPNSKVLNLESETSSVLRTEAMCGNN